ncbi:myc-associated zinc finger protein isoform X2 [Conger conger]|uniref:myc-associated zinc finger protein isoform X2 n=1 Tax=Conger conger TaxID=82655 RepID=UPI002A5A85BE|nr:myc-associated zinc finger protein isoform X2 [Conger conger]
MDAAWSNFLFQNTPTQTQVEATLQSDLLPVLTGSAQNPPTEHIAPPPSTVDTAALNEEPLPAKPVSRPARAAHICPLCNKQFKNSYNLRRHQSVHTGIRMKDKAAREREAGMKEGAAAAVGRVERQTVPLSLLHLSVPPPLPPPAMSVPHPSALGNQEGEVVAMSVTTANVTMAGPPPPPAAVVIAGATVQRAANPSPNPVRKNHACEACGKAFRDVYHLNRHRLSHSDEKPYSCPICQQRFKRKDRMSYHVRSHQGGVEKPYVCPHCAKGFSRPDHLNSHVRQVHSKERPFKCETCESAFATRDRLRAHMIRHEEKVPCHICGKLLSAAYITDHMRVHNQSQHHACHLCNRSFTTLTYLRVHAQKHHGQEWKESAGQRGGFGGTGPGGVLLCQLCGVHCKTPTQLQGHMGTHTSPHTTPSPITTTTASSSSISLGNMVSGPSVFVSGNTGVGLLVSDCSGIAPQSHS